MDQLASKVIDHLPNDGNSVFILLGDHGMTVSGDHGGSTTDETDTPLFIYRKGYGRQADISRDFDRNKVIEEVDQLDLAPLLARMLDIPIPYLSIGGYVDPAMIQGDKLRRCSKGVMRDILINALQVTRYWTTYSNTASLNIEAIRQISENVNKLTVKAMDTHITILESHNWKHEEIMEVECDQLLQEYKEIFAYSKRKARVFWTTFNGVYMIIGMLLLACVVAGAFVYLFFNSDLLKWKSLPLYDKIMTTFIVLHTLTVFSNSFIEKEIDILYKMLIMSTVAFVAAQIYFAFGKYEGTIENGPIRKPVQWGDGWENSWSALVVMLYCNLTLSGLLKNKRHAKHLTDIESSLLDATFGTLFFPCILILLRSAYFIAYDLIGPLTKDAQTVFFKRDNDYAIRGKWLDVISFGVYCKAWTYFSPMLESMDNNWDTINGGTTSAHMVYCWSFTGILISLTRSFLAPYPSPAMAPDLLFCHISCILTMLAGPLGPYKVCAGIIPTLASTRKSTVGSILAAFFVGRFMFFATGHGYSFNTLQVEAGLVGLNEFDFVISGIQLAINTFGYDALLFLAVLNRIPYHNLNDTLLFALLHRTFLLLGTCLSVFILQDHLMLWDIFAPRLIFEISFFAVFLMMTFTVLTCSDVRAFVFRSKLL